MLPATAGEQRTAGITVMLAKGEQRTGPITPPIQIHLSTTQGTMSMTIISMSLSSPILNNIIIVRLKMNINNKKKRRINRSGY